MPSPPSYRSCRRPSGSAHLKLPAAAPLHESACAPRRLPQGPTVSVSPQGPRLGPSALPLGWSQVCAVQNAVERSFRFGIVGYLEAGLSVNDLAAYNAWADSGFAPTPPEGPRCAACVARHAARRMRA